MQKQESKRKAPSTDTDWQSLPSRQAPPHTGNVVSAHAGVPSGKHRQVRKGICPPSLAQRSPGGQVPLQVKPSPAQVNGNVVVVVGGAQPVVQASQQLGHALGVPPLV